MFIAKYYVLLASVLGVKGSDDNTRVVIDDNGIRVVDDKGNDVVRVNTTIVDDKKNVTIVDDKKNVTIVDDKQNMVNGGSTNVMDKMMILSLLTLLL